MECQAQFAKLALLLLVDLKSGSLRFFERTKVCIYYDISPILTAKKCKSLSLYLKFFT